MAAERTLPFPESPVTRPAPRKWWQSTLVPFLSMAVIVNLLCYFALGNKLTAIGHGLGALIDAQATENNELKTALADSQTSAVTLADANRRAVETAVEVNRHAVEAAVAAAAANQEQIRQTVQRDADETQRKRDLSLALVVEKVTQLAQGVELALGNASSIAATSRNAAQVAASAAREAAYASAHTANVVASKVVTAGDKKRLEAEQAKAAALNSTLQTRVKQYKDARKKLQQTH